MPVTVPPGGSLGRLEDQEEGGKYRAGRGEVLVVVHLVIGDALVSDSGIAGGFVVVMVLALNMVMPGIVMGMKGGFVMVMMNSGDG